MIKTKMKKDFNWNKYLKECLESTKYCCIATIDPKGVWANPVYFAYDENFNLYFISQMKSRHMQNLKKDSRISVSIYKTEQKGDVVGTYIEGKAKIILDDKEEIQKAFDVYYGRAGKGPDVQGYIDNPTWIYVKIVPEIIYYLDTKILGEDRQEVPLDKIR